MALILGASWSLGGVLCLYLSLSLCLCLGSGPISGAEAALEAADVGNWTVGKCIMAQFAMEFTLRPEAINPNKTVLVKVGPRAKADKDQKYCGNTTQELNLHWYDAQRNNTAELLFRNITITIGRNNSTK